VREPSTPKAARDAGYRHRLPVAWWFNHRRRSVTLRANSVVDTPTATDLLGYEGFAGAIAERVLTLGLDQTPLTIGIFGEWGSGKTSLLKMVDAALRNARLSPMWFDAWKYDQEDNLWSAHILNLSLRLDLPGHKIAVVSMGAKWIAIQHRLGEGEDNR
jgi:KAP family P-loop domain